MSNSSRGFIGDISKLEPCLWWRHCLKKTFIDNERGAKDLHKTRICEQRLAYLTSFILIDFPIRFATLSMNMSILYFKVPQDKISNFYIFLPLYIVCNLGNSSDPD